MNMHISQGLSSLDTEEYQAHTPAGENTDAQFVTNSLHPVYVVANRQLPTEISTQFVGNF